MPAKKSKTKTSVSVKSPKNSFAEFLADPLISTALIVFALIALLFSIIEFTNALAY